MSKIVAPKIPHHLTNAFEADLTDSYMQHILFTGAFPLPETESLVINQSKFENVFFEGRYYPKFDLTDVLFEKCNLSNVTLYSSTVHRVTFSDCKLTGVDFSDSLLHNVTFQNCLLDLAGFSFSKFKNATFIDCQLTGAEFESTEFKQFSFQNCLLTDCLFANTSLSGLDFTSCTFEKLIASIESLKGLKVNEEQALKLSTLLGIIIE
ncbi:MULTISPECIES: pentapeptide repeat-containing protein [Listeria]|uniref:pentapeptide repeat-containing protein n=1 Tax=Listeria TaxID=1637 RepID=UPI000B59037C|nr:MULTISPECIES: pentapeptide repeat-containing protein [Listeria]